MSLKKRVFKAFFWLVFVFIILFIFRLIYGYVAYPSGQEQVQNTGMYDFSPSSSGQRNFASAKYEFKKGSSSAPQVVSVDQKYEKTANNNWSSCSAGCCRA